jgi:hypothetical protein
MSDEFTPSDDLEFNIWYKNGVDRGWISEIFCDTHEGAPMTDDEELEWSEGGDPCSFHVKIMEA